SRRRHTSSKRDWSSDVCSSDLFLDSDDKWLPEKLSTQLAFMQKHDYAFTYTKYVRMKENGELTNGVSEAPKKLTYNQLMKHCVIGCLTVMLDREKIGEARRVKIRKRKY